MKQQDKVIVRDLTETNISNMPDRELKATIILGSCRELEVQLVSGFLTPMAERARPSLPPFPQVVGPRTRPTGPWEPDLTWLPFAPSHRAAACGTPREFRMYGKPNLQGLGQVKLH